MRKKRSRIKIPRTDAIDIRLQRPSANPSASTTYLIVAKTFAVPHDRLSLDSFVQAFSTTIRVDAFRNLQSLDVKQR
jgi:hypothetical protein